MAETKSTKKSIIVKLKSGVELKVPDVLNEDLKIFVDDMLKSEMDFVIVIDGKEGCGKSYTGRGLASLLANICGTPFGVDNIHFTLADYITFAEKGQKFQVNVLDESRNELNRKRAMSKSNVMFTNWLSENRDKQQVHILILPAIHDLDSYITSFRMSLFIHCMKLHLKTKNTSLSGYELVRGYFRVYKDPKDISKVIFNRNKFGYFAYPKELKYQRRWGASEVFTAKQLKEYSLKKQEKRTFKYAQELGEKAPTKQAEQRNRVWEHMHKSGSTHKQIAEVSDVEESTVQKALGRMKKKNNDTQPSY